MVLQEMLRVLCLDTGWRYAVFWKLKRRSRMVVTWEDGYCEAVKLNSAFDNLPWSTQDTPEGIEGGIPVEDGVRQQEIGLAVAKMSYQVYALGEGIIGRVAFTGKHQWVLSAGEESNGSINVEANCGGSGLRLTIDKYPDEWQNQFAVGIKTIAVIAVLGGVVQLGSTHTIMEDLEWVDHIRSMFGILQGIPEAFPSDLVTNWQEKVHGQSLGSAFGRSASNHQFRSTQTLKLDRLVSPPVGDRYSQKGIGFSKGCEIIQAAIPIVPNRDWKSEIPQTFPSGRQKIPLYATSMECQEFLYPHRGQRLPYSDMFGDVQRKTYPDGSGKRSCQVNIQMPTKCNTNSFKLPLGRDEGNINANNTSSSDIYQPIVEKMVGGQVSPQDLGWDTDFVIGDELSQALGPAFQRKSDGLFGEESKMESNIQPSGSGMVEKFICNYGKEEEINKGCPYVLESEPDVIEASAVQPSQVAADDFSCKSTMSGIESEMLELSPARFKADNDPYSSECFQGKKSEESGKESRKRARPGESGRLRPKDRQQIQDRVRELRDIIPNGSKCSIDSLLEKTIKHMLFLQSVSCHADVLKQSRDIKANTGRGTTAALEFRGHGTEHPIIVEYLKNPNQMLVEMLCEERGLFLEIADTIRGLGLTILKGVIESRPDNIWACFIVEPNNSAEESGCLPFK